MSPSRHRAHWPARYQIRMNAHLDERWATRFDGLTLTQHDDGTTTLTGLIQDQSQLHGLLDKVRDLGLTLIDIRALANPEMNNDSQEHDR